MGSVEPVEQLEPSGHGLHCSDAVRPMAPEKDPFAHGSGVDAPRGQNDAVVHLRHAVSFGAD